MGPDTRRFRGDRRDFPHVTSGDIKYSVRERVTCVAAHVNPRVRSTFVHFRSGHLVAEALVLPPLPSPPLARIRRYIDSTSITTSITHVARRVIGQ